MIDCWGKYSARRLHKSSRYAAHVPHVPRDATGGAAEPTRKLCVMPFAGPLALLWQQRGSRPRISRRRDSPSIPRICETMRSATSHRDGCPCARRRPLHLTTPTNAMETNPIKRVAPLSARLLKSPASYLAPCLFSNLLLRRVATGMRQPQGHVLVLVDSCRRQFEI